MEYDTVEKSCVVKKDGQTITDLYCLNVEKYGDDAYLTLKTEKRDENNKMSEMTTVYASGSPQSEFAEAVSKMINL